MTSDSSENELSRIFSNKRPDAYLKFLKVRGAYLNLGKFLSKRNEIHIKRAYFIHFPAVFS